MSLTDIGFYVYMILVIFVEVAFLKNIFYNRKTDRCL